MKVTQQMIADKLGLTQSTVARILKRNPRDTYSKDTIDKVLRTARDMGYSINHKRTYVRKDLNVTCNFEVRLQDKALYSRGVGIIRNLSRDGLLLSDITVEGDFIPSKPFYMMVQIPEAGLDDLYLKCKPMRIAIQDNKIEVGLRFFSLQKKRLKALKEAFSV